MELVVGEKCGGDDDDGEELVNLPISFGVVALYHALDAMIRRHMGSGASGRGPAKAMSPKKAEREGFWCFVPLWSGYSIQVKSMLHTLYQ